MASVGALPGQDGTVLADIVSSAVEELMGGSVMEKYLFDGVVRASGRLLSALRHRARYR